MGIFSPSYGLLPADHGFPPQKPDPAGRRSPMEEAVPAFLKAPFGGLLNVVDVLSLYKASLLDRDMPPHVAYEMVLGRF